MQSSPLVTVYMPTKDRLRLLQRAVDSVLAQDHANLELIVVDDGSRDGTADWLKAKAQEDPRLRFAVNERSQGACTSRNIAIGMAEGEFITGLDDDDYFLPSHLSSLLQCWPNRRRGVVALFPHVLILDQHGALTKVRHGKPSRAVERQKDLLTTNRIGSQLFLPRAVLLEVGGFDPQFPAWQDLECWYRVLGNGGSAQCSGAHTYVADVGHDHGRITTSGADRIRTACERFAAKHALSWWERQVLRANYHACVVCFGLEGPVPTFVRRATHYALRVLR